MYSSFYADQWTHLQQLAIKLDKYVLAAPELDFLGHRISAVGITPLRDNVQVIGIRFPYATGHQVSATVPWYDNLYHCFLPRVARRLQPLTASFAGNPKVFPRMPQMDSPFTATKADLVMLAHPCPSAVPFSLAPPTHTSAESSSKRYQLGSRPGNPLGSSVTNSPRLNRTTYSTFDRELLAAAFTGICPFCTRLDSTSNVGTYGGNFSCGPTTNCLMPP